MSKLPTVIAYTFLHFFTLVLCDCGIKGPTSQQSADLLKKLEPLKGSVFTHTFKDADQDKYKYTISICEPLPGSKGAGVIQQDLTTTDTTDQTPKAVGLINSTAIKGGTDWVMLTYMDGDKYNHHCQSSTTTNRQAHIMIVCDPWALKGDFRVLYEENNMESEAACFYMMELSSNAVCSKQGLSMGSVFLIVFFSLTAAYLLFGAIYKRCVYGSKGFDQIPNIGFWKSCGSLQADGCNFMCRSRDSAYTESRPYHGIADDQLDEEVDDEHLLPM